MEVDHSRPYYIIVQIDILDPEHYREYQEEVRPVVAEYGYELLVSSRAEPNVIEGNWNPQSMIVMRFDSKQQADLMMQDVRWQHAASLRQKCAKTNMIGVQGEIEQI